MSFKIKKEQIIYNGLSGIRIPQGSIVEVLKTSHSNVGDILKRTDNDTCPFLTIKSDTKFNTEFPEWGDSIGGYIFKVLNEQEKKNLGL